MNTRTDHYTFLGVPMNAPPSAIAAAIDRIKAQADAMRATSPAQAALIDEKLQRAEADLLSGPQRREGYDRWLMSTKGTPQPTVVAPLPQVPQQSPPYSQYPGQYTAYMPPPTEPLASKSSNSRWLIPLIAVLALLVGAAGAFAATKLMNGRSQAVSATVTPQPSATPRPAPTMTPQPQPSATSAPQATATTAPPTGDALTLDPAVIEKHGYTPAQGHAETSDGSGGTLYAWAAVCSSSADGYCQRVFFFDGTRYLGTDTATDSTSISDVSTVGPQTIGVTYANYLPSDPLCCPSGKPVTIKYYWTGSKLIPSGTPPGH
jgi:hypothetical protein